jgi:hypothetical protein
VEKRDSTFRFALVSQEVKRSSYRCTAMGDELLGLRPVPDCPASVVIDYLDGWRRLLRVARRRPARCFSASWSSASASRLARPVRSRSRGGYDFEA